YAVGALFLWPLVVGWMRCIRGYRIRELEQVRRRARRLLTEACGPVLICPNHLTWIDSLLVQWAITSPRQVLASYRLFAWNTPEQTNFYAKFWLRLGCYLGKCIPVVRGGDRAQQNLALEKLSHLLRRGELAMVFPEGSRSRTGRIDLEHLAHGIGRLVKEVENCRVLCVYMRGDRQDGRSVLPPAGQRFSLDMELIEPRSDKKGLRATREIVMQIADKLVDMEDRYFARW
ncbi:MAG: lysophospholipid acyltransferase family protein, partial [Deltaproteobacteria bacterium]|nr:lysophospholipid acyltransferase family protein [Deltaproteobacteria bacterium]